ncbi:DUF4241 domain-containing protein [Actinoplanes regularis]|uniref:DUF4241 domain-containing protein n=1 Tax=Actinoplanes regularis TaxID=52697 RepID=UPI0025558CC7|nr:DUF4241 domain-containing protein [Actinoplanes regularis]
MAEITGCGRMGWSRRNAIRLALAAGAVGLGGCERPAVEPQRDVAPRGFPLPEQTAGLFRDGSRHQLDNGDWVTATTKAGGTLRMPTGRLIAADPNWFWNAENLNVVPYTVTVPAGSYPVTLAVVSWPDISLVAAARLTVQHLPIQSWEMALRPGQDLTALAPGEAYNVGVDAGMMALLDGAALTRMTPLVDSDPALFELKARDEPIEVPGTGSGGNLIAFGTGWGDGGYPVWIGRTATGSVGCFMVDMAMLSRRESMPPLIN